MRDDLAGVRGRCCSAGFGCGRVHVIEMCLIELGTTTFCDGRRLYVDTFDSERCIVSAFAPFLRSACVRYPG
jgi:hypothetical protein